MMTETYLTEYIGLDSGNLRYWDCYAICLVEADMMN